MENKPGVVVYFDMLPMLEQLSDKNKGILFQSILEYGNTGRQPMLPPKLQLLWPLIQMRLDADGQRYQMVVNQRKYANYARWSRNRGEEPVSFDEWLCDIDYEEE